MWGRIISVIKGVLAKVKGTSEEHPDRPAARLVAIAVCSKAKGTGLAQELVDHMEKFMVSKGFEGSYVILTEKTNKQANKFYKKIGAKFVRTNLRHGRAINEWHKEIIPAKKNSD